MTCRDKLAMEYPEAIDWRCAGGSEYCPHNFGYASKPKWCKLDREKCKTCWDRPALETNVIDDIRGRMKTNTGESKECKHLTLRWCWR